jgi:AraC family transcriptional activator FtrA
VTAPAAGRAHRVVVLVTNQVSLTELGHAQDVFATANHPHTPRYDVVVSTARPGPVHTREGHDLLVSRGLDAVEQADTIVLPGCWPVTQTPDAGVVNAVRLAHARGARVAATCTGVSVAAAAGLLDGRTATTHWAHADAFTHCYPRVLLQPDVLYIDHDDVATSAGNSAGLDLYLHFVGKDHGAAVAARVSRHLVGPQQRDGARPQLLANPLTHCRPDPLAAVLENLATHLADHTPVAQIAAGVGLSERTLRRYFHDQLGTTPGQWLLTERLRYAQRLLETTDLPIETIAHRVGLTSATALRRQFRRELNTTPTEHRRTRTVHGQARAKRRIPAVGP